MTVCAVSSLAQCGLIISWCTSPVWLLGSSEKSVRAVRRHDPAICQKRDGIQVVGRSKRPIRAPDCFFIFISRIRKDLPALLRESFHYPDDAKQGLHIVALLPECIGAL